MNLIILPKVPIGKKDLQQSKYIAHVSMNAERKRCEKKGGSAVMLPL